jgi:hypothetical protein
MSRQDHFREILLTVVGQAFTAAGYTLQERPIHWAGGRFRFINAAGHIIECQLLAYVDTEWSAGMPSRFRVTLRPADAPDRDLSALVVEDFGVSILPSAAHWWTFRTVEELGQALAEAGHLVIGYGIPWLAGELKSGGKPSGE